ncbi:hypothetical protein [Pyrobaculum sp.]|uniref:hypothetical protein n=1 Tax=Pyrobaculum sp. TaxID=2004705 RepID=UPI00316DFC02
MTDVICIAGLCFSPSTAIAYSILAIYAGYKLIRALSIPGQLQHELTDLIKEAAVFAVVLWAVSWIGTNLYKTTGVLYPSDEVKKLIDEAWIRTVKSQQCIANIRLSGPFSAYASYAEAKLSVYTTVYESSLWTLSQLRGIQAVLQQYGPVILAIAFALYAAWLRPIGGAVIGVVLGAWLGVATFATYAPGQITFLQQHLQGMDFHPFVDLGCDDRLANMYKQDIEGWRTVAAMAILTLSLSVLVGGSAGYLLGRH